MRKKLGKIGKSVLSVIICLTMLLTTFCFFDIGSVISEAAVSVDNINPAALTFYVPETIYLAASTSTTNTFKYYVDRGNSSSGFALRTGEQTSGNIYFNCSSATSVKSISLSDTSSVSIGQTTSSNGTLETTITAGTLSTALSPGGTKLLTWTVVYVYNGVEYTANAYSVAYAPWPTVVSGSACGRYDSKYSGRKTAFMITAWISGIHSVVDSGTGSDGTADS